MRFIRPALDFLKKEKATSFMLGFILTAIAASQILSLTSSRILHETVDAGLQSTVPSVTPDAADSTKEKEDFKKAGEEVARKLQENKRSIAVIGLGIVLVFAAGLCIDAMFLLFWKSAPPPAWMRPVDRDQIPWFPGDVFKAVVVMLFSELVLSCGVVFFTGRLGEEAESALLMANTFIRNVVLVVYVIWLIRRRYGARLESLGLHLRHFLKLAAVGVTAYVGFLPIYFIVLVVLMGIIKLLGVEPPVQQVVQMMYEEDRAVFLAAFSVFIAFLGPFFEETFFRGFVYQAFKKRWGVMTATIAVSAIFALLHAYWVALIPIFALSVVLCFLFEKTGSLVPGIVLHVLHNGITLAIMFGVKSLSS